MALRRRSPVAPGLLATNTPSAGRSPRTTIRVNVAKSCRRLPPNAHLSYSSLLSSNLHEQPFLCSLTSIRTKSITPDYVLSYSDHANEQKVKAKAPNSFFITFICYIYLKRYVIVLYYANFFRSRSYLSLPFSYLYLSAGTERKRERDSNCDNVISCAVCKYSFRDTYMHSFGTLIAYYANV